MRMVLAITSILLSVAATATPQGITESASKQIQALAPKLLAQAKEPGLTVVLIENCSATWRGDFGFANTAEKRPVDGKTLFQFGSMSKTVTAWAVMTLVETGEVKLDAPVNRYLKSWKLTSANFDTEDVTVRRVLNHSAGLSVPSLSGVDFGTKVPSIVDELKGLGPSKTPVTIIEKPGTKYLYSGGGYAILQLLIEDVTGLRFDEYLRKKIFKPLGMTTATFSPNRKALSKAATPYSKEGEALSFRLFSGEAGAGLYSTVDDYARFVVAQCARDNKVLKASTVASMFESDTVSQRYGLGYELLPKLGDNPIVAHSGSNHGWKANFMLFPIEGVGIIVATNSDVGEASKKVLKVWRDAVIAKFKPAKP